MIDTILSKGWEKGDISAYKPLPFTYKKRALIVWEEHCVECSPPYCYHHCENYLQRIDKKCVRMTGGIQRIKGVNGSLSYGISCHFRKWAKLESRFTNKRVGDKLYVLCDKLNRAFGKMALTIARCFSLITPSLKPYGAYIAFRQFIMECLRTQNEQTPEILYIQCQLQDKDDVQFQIQMETKDSIVYSQIHRLHKGINEISIPLSNIPSKEQIWKTYLTPLEDTDTHIVFIYIDFFYGVVQRDSFEQKPAEKVKVVAWDLDNTLWNGVLVEDDDVIIKKDVLECIKQLDAKGILNTIVSKNDYEVAWKKLESFGIADYFLAPAINWGQKSENLKSIAKYLNLGVDAFAFIDDNIREREEVKNALPMVRVYDENIVTSLLNLPEFDVPITEVSRTRRLSYMQEVKRKAFEANFTDNYDSFLRSLEMELDVEPINENNYNRCFELLSRSNQLNLSTNRYSIEEYKQLIEDKRNICCAFRCKDKFGDYGIVSFLSVKIDGPKATIVDFVISCRVAKKKVEEACIFSMKDKLIEKGICSIEAKLIKTKKNGPIAAVFDDMPFKVLSSDENKILYVLDDLSNIKDSDIIKIVYEF